MVLILEELHQLMLSATLYVWLTRCVFCENAGVCLVHSCCFKACKAVAIYLVKGRCWNICGLHIRFYFRVPIVVLMLNFTFDTSHFYV